MLIRFLRLFYGCVTFTYKNGFVDGFMDGCLKNGIYLHKARIKKDSLVAQCSISDYQRLHTIAHKSGGVVRVQKKHGLVFLLLPLRNRAGLMVGALVGVMLMSMLSGFVWNIEIVGNEKLPSETISAFLDTQGVHQGVHWKSFNKGAVEDMIMATFDDVAWVHINRIGTTARVEIQEATLKPSIVDKNYYTNLKATKDGVIVYARVFDGWQVAKVGEAVVAGDLLVSGIYESEHAKQNMFVHARGEYIAQVYEEFSLSVAREQKYKAYKKPKKYNSLYLFGVYIPLYVGKCPQKSVDIEKENQYLYINSKPVPVGIIKRTVTKYAVASRILNDEELQTLMEQEIDKIIDETYGLDNVVSRDINITLGDDEAVAKGSLEVMEQIAQEIGFMGENIDEE